jgi:hypothetical protein
MSPFETIARHDTGVDSRNIVADAYEFMGYARSHPGRAQHHLRDAAAFFNAVVATYKPGEGVPRPPLFALVQKLDGAGGSPDSATLAATTRTLAQQMNLLATGPYVVTPTLPQGLKRNLARMLA